MLRMPRRSRLLSSETQSDAGSQRPEMPQIFSLFPFWPRPFYSLAQMRTPDIDVLRISAEIKIWLASNFHAAALRTGNIHRQFANAAIGCGASDRRI